MKRNVLIPVIIIALLFTLCRCSDEDSGETGSEGLRKTTAGLNIQVDESSGSMNIERPKIKSIPMGDKDTWTIFVYLCGSDLESRIFFGGGMASDDLEEMCRASASDSIRFVIETGGCSYWHDDNIDSDYLCRYVVEDGKLKNAGEVRQASMGKTSTLTGFLKWGIRNYPAEKMGVVFWDHGGGSLSGVCFDELEDNDSLGLREIDAAFLSLADSGELTDKFEFIGFDACLMGTVEAANILASYSDYMFGSEESEPGSGWDYKAIGDYLAKHPDADGASLGKVVCDSFKKQCDESGDGQIATLSVIDLSQMDPLLKSFNSFSRQIYQKSEDKEVLSSMVRKINSVDNFGGNNKAEGYTNMVDLGGIISSCKKWSDKAEAAGNALNKAVVYKVSGADHKKASGLSTYYPLMIEGSEELSIFEGVCISPYYMSFVGRQGYGSANGGNTEDYDDGDLYEGGVWEWLNSFLFDEETGEYEFDDEYEDEGGFWDFLDDYEGDAQSELISFEYEPGMSSAGEYYFVLDDEGSRNTCDVIALVYNELDDGTYVELGETYDVNIDWDSGYVSDNFDGYWLSLPDGQNLATYIVDVTDDYIIYTSPILLNGEDTHLRMRQYLDDGRVKVEGAWEGIDEYGASDKDIIKLRKGDKITPLYYCIDEDGEDLDEYEGESYTIKSDKGTLKVEYDYLYAGDYSYAFCITDIYGDDYVTDLISFNLSENGEISFYED
jgi:hypothetical protein